MPTGSRELAIKFLNAHVHKEHTPNARALLYKLYGTLWQHYKNKHVYKIIGFSWSGDLDEWCIEYKRPGSRIKYNRSFSNAFGYIDGVHHRFTEVIAE